eukprot:8387242-Prorocentrum_lima.AAC.1
MLLQCASPRWYYHDPPELDKETKAESIKPVTCTSMLRKSTRQPTCPAAPPGKVAFTWGWRLPAK